MYTSWDEIINTVNTVTEGWCIDPSVGPITTTSTGGQIVINPKEMTISTRPWNEAPPAPITEQKETKSKLETDALSIYVSLFEDGRCTKKSKRVMPNIIDVRVYNDDAGNPCAVYLDFADNTSTSAAIRDNTSGGKDTFDLESGITICLAKKLLDMKTDGHGGAVYNKLVRLAKKRYDLAVKANEELEKEKAEYERRYNKLIEKKKRRKARLEAKKREEQIEIQKEAILRALRESNLSK